MKLDGGAPVERETVRIVKMQKPGASKVTQDDGGMCSRSDMIGTIERTLSLNGNRSPFQPTTFIGSLR